MAAKKEQTPRFSQTISDAVQMMDTAVKDYAWSRDQVNQMDISDALTDYLREGAKR